MCTFPLFHERQESDEIPNINPGEAFVHAKTDFSYFALPTSRYEPNRGDGRDPRSKALELFTGFEREMATTYSTNYSRLPGTNVRSFLLRCTNGPLAGVGQRDLHLVADDYEHARHRHEKFGQVTDRTVIS